MEEHKSCNLIIGKLAAMCSKSPSRIWPCEHYGWLHQLLVFGTDAGSSPGGEEECEWSSSSVNSLNDSASDPETKADMNVSSSDDTFSASISSDFELIMNVISVLYQNFMMVKNYP